MDRAQVNTAMPYLVPASAAPSHGMLLGRLSAYWRALGVSDPDQIAALSEQALRRGLPDRPESPDPLTGVLAAARDLLDDWLVRTLDLPRQPQALAAARAALLGGAVQAQIELDGPGLKLRSAVRATRDGQVQLSDLGAEAEAGWLAPALAIPALEPTGTLSVNGASLTLDRTHLPRAVDATLYWNQAGVRGQAVARLGSLTLTAQGQDGHIQLNIHDAGDGELEVRGSATLDGARYRSEVVLVPRVAEGPVVQALQWVGEARPEGGRLLIVEGQIVLPQETL